MRQGQGLTDKLYWRQVHLGARHHCFKKADGGRGTGYVSLCGRETLSRVGGQRCGRPIEFRRCPICDSAEMERRGATESMPENCYES